MGGNWGLGLFLNIKRIDSRDEQPCKIIETKESVYLRKKFNSHMIDLGHKHGHFFTVWDTIMAAVRPCESPLCLGK